MHLRFFIPYGMSIAIVEVYLIISVQVFKHLMQQETMKLGGGGDSIGNHMVHVVYSVCDNSVTYGKNGLLFLLRVSLLLHICFLHVLQWHAQIIVCLRILPQQINASASVKFLRFVLSSTSSNVLLNTSQKLCSAFDA